MSNPVFSLDGRVCLLTGAAGYLGQAMARALCQSGAEVFLVGRNAEALDSLQTELRSEGFSAWPLQLDITRQADVHVAVSNLRKRNQRVDVLVNNAYVGGGGTSETAESEEYGAAYDIAVVAAARLTRQLLPMLRESGSRIEGGASVINVASMYGLVSPDLRIYRSSEVANAPFYGAAKAALIQWTRYVACELAPSNIRVNSISPGPFPKPEVLLADPRFHEALSNRVPLGRIGSPSEVGAVVAFLASSAASYVTGANLAVDGGWTAW